MLNSRDLPSPGAAAGGLASPFDPLLHRRRLALLEIVTNGFDAPMDKDRFWRIIESSRRAAASVTDVEFADAHMRTLAEELKRLSPEEIVAFHAAYVRRYHEAYRWDLWAVAYHYGGGCSDDGFIDFRSCLVSLGQELYNRILADPDSLADVLDRPDIPYMLAEGFLYVADEVYKELTGEEMPTNSEPHPQDPVGRRFDHDDESLMRRNFPRLTARIPRNFE
jgi:hypothetical protein